MNAKELIALAEEWKAGTLGHAGIDQVLEYVLQHVKEDDDELLTDDYFHSIPFGKYGILAIVKEGESYFAEIRLRTNWSLTLVASHRIREVKTRKDVRDILTALGVNQ